MNKEERIAVPFTIILPEKTTVGATGSKALVELRDNKRILGIRCPDCNRTYMPPRLSCPICFRKMDEWVELSGKGSLLTYSIVYYSESYHPTPPPIIYGIIQLDGADTGLPHILAEVDLEELKIGMRVEAVFKEERKGSILDIRYFRPSKR